MQRRRKQTERYSTETLQMSICTDQQQKVDIQNLNTANVNKQKRSNESEIYSTARLQMSACKHE